ncbi:MAG TPA: ROK family protein [Clostridia bacterium]
MAILGKNSKDLKELNKKLILKLICLNNQLSRIQLSKMTSLSKMTITNITSELINDEWIEESASQPSTTSGPKPVNLIISEKAPKLLGLAFRRKRIGVVVTSLDFKILHQKYVGYTDEDSVQDILNICYSLIDEAIEKYTIIGIGVTSPGPVDSQSGTILNPPNMGQINNIEIVKILENRYGLKVHLNKDTQGSAIAEKFWGNGKDINEFIYYSYASGIGASIISGGILYQPHDSYAGEVGHMSLSFNGPKCKCGNNGCLEVFCSASKLTQEINERLNTNYSFLDCMNAYENPKTYDIFETQINFMAISMISLINAFNPSCIIIGDRGSELPQPLIDKLTKKINDTIFAKQHKYIPVIKSRFGRDSALYGSAAIVADSIFKTE